jgi:3-isopropylmalate/(R)-2-methylmalate dehydratase small subunit
MKKVTSVKGTAAPLMVANVTTDMISPSSLYRTVDADFARGLFGPWRYLDDGSDNPSFVLNQPRYRNTRILVSGKNFGCGSSRELAVWCLQRFGIECVIAPSFGEIFFENAFKNGLVTIELDEPLVNELGAELSDARLAPVMSVDIATKALQTPSGRVVAFEMDEITQTSLLDGVDELQMLLREEPRIATFQSRARSQQPWLVPLPLPRSEKATP